MEATMENLLKKADEIKGYAGGEERAQQIIDEVLDEIITNFFEIINTPKN